MTMLNIKGIQSQCYVLLFVAISFSSCNKTKDYPKLNLLIEKEWKLKTIEKDDEDITSDCNKDDVLTFNDEKSFDYNFGVENCDDSETSKKSIKWKIIEDFTVLRMKYKLNENSSKASLIEYWEIIELNDSLLVVQDALAEDNNQTPEVFTFKNE